MTRRLIYTLFFLLAVPAILMTCFRPLTSLDLDWHIAAGRWMLENGSVPWVDVFSHSANGNAWNNHQVGGDLLLGWLYQLSDGYFSIRLLMGFACLGFLFLLWQRARKMHWPMAVFLPLLVTFFYVIFVRFQPRPFFMGQFCFALALFCWSPALKGDKRAIGFFVFTALLWTNFHGNYLIALLIFPLLAFAAKAEERKIALGLSSALFVIWPLHAGGFEMSLYPVKQLLSPAANFSFYYHFVQELAPPDFSSFNHQSIYVLVMLVATLYFVFYCYKKFGLRRITEILALIVLLVFFFKSRRNVFPLAIFVSYFIMRLDLFGSVYTFKRPKVLLTVSILLLTVGPIMQLSFFYQAWGKVSYSQDRASKYKIDSCIARIKDMKAKGYLKGNMYNDFALGSALIKGLGEKSVFVDGRCEIYGAAFLENAYWKFSRDRSKDDSADHFRDEIVKKHNITFAVLNYRKGGNFQTLSNYFGRKKWRLFHVDHTCFVMADSSLMPKSEAFLTQEKVSSEFCRQFKEAPKAGEILLREMARFGYLKMMEPLIDYLIERFPERNIAPQFKKALEAP
jgi:hypothetical protein